MPRLAVLDRLPPDTRVLIPPNVQAFQLEMLGWLGLDDRIRRAAEKHLLVEDYYFSVPTAMTGCTNPYAVQFLRDRFLSRADRSFDGPEKIYVLRQDKSRGVVNEREVVSFLSERGWTAVDPEGLSMARQIRLFAGARAVCGVHGAGLTNIVWCDRRCTVVELFADNYLNGCFESITACLDVEHRYLIFPGDEDHRVRVALDALDAVLPD
jgi:capsular polysaccharide biosynthesis protein